MVSSHHLGSTAPPRCCLILAGFAGSVVSFRGHLISALVAAGYKVHVAAPGLGATSQAHEEVLALGAIPHDIALHRTGLNPVSDAWYAAQVLRLARRVQPEFALAYTVKPIVYGLLAAHLGGVTRTFALVTGLGYAFTSGAATMVGRVVRVLYRSTLTKVEKVFFQNPDDLSLFRDERLLPQATSAVVVNGSGVDTSFFSSSALPADGPTFLMLGRLLGDKGVREYARAAAIIRQRYPQVECLLGGWIDDGPDAIDREELDGWISSGAIRYLGPLGDVRPAIALAHVYVLPSYREGTPRTVLEAMAMGRPVITTDAPGCRETVDDGQNGFLVPVGSVDALVVSMAKFIENPGLAPRMGSCSRRIAEEKYDVRKVNAIMLAEMGVAPASEERHDGG